MANSDLVSLRKSITQLGKRWNELKALSIATESLDTKLEILDEMDLVNGRIARLETLRNHMEVALVTVAPPSAEDKKHIEGALSTLSSQISKDMKWAAALKLTKQFMVAVHTVHTNITGRQKPTNS